MITQTRTEEWVWSVCVRVLTRVWWTTRANTVESVWEELTRYNN